MKILLILSAIGLVLSMGVVLVSVMLPIVQGPHVSWEEAAWGIIPGAFCAFVCFALSVLSAVLLFTGQQSSAKRPRRRSRVEEDDEDEED